MLVLSSAWSSKDSKNKAAFLNKTEGGDSIISVSAWSTAKIFPYQNQHLRNAWVKLDLKQWNQSVRWISSRQTRFLYWLHTNQTHKAGMTFRFSSTGEHKTGTLISQTVFNFCISFFQCLWRQIKCTWQTDYIQWRKMEIYSNDMIKMLW